MIPGANHFLRLKLASFKGFAAKQSTLILTVRHLKAIPKLSNANLLLYATWGVLRGTDFFTQPLLRTKVVNAASGLRGCTSPSLFLCTEL